MSAKLRGPERLVLLLLLFVAMRAGVSVLFTGAGVAAEATTFDPERPQCGHWAVLRCCDLLGIPMDMQSVMQSMPASKDGHDMLTLAKVLRGMGLRAEGRMETLSDLMELGGKVAVAHLEPDHYVVVVGVDETHVTHFDGEGRRRLWPADRFRGLWSGKVLWVWEQADKPVPPISSGKQARSTPKIKFSTLYLDKGQVSSTGEPVRFVFPFRNIGNKPLLIDRIQVSCKCLGATKPEQGIAPGDKGSIVLNYAPEGKGGSFAYSAIVHTNDPSARVLRLTAAGSMDARVSVEPRYLDFGSTPAGATRTRRCTVNYSGDIPFRVDKVECSVAPSVLEYRLLERAPRKAETGPRHEVFKPEAKSFFLELTLAPSPGVEGMLGGAVYISTNVSGFERISIPVTGEVVSPISAFPDTLFLGNAAISDPIDTTVVVKSEVGKALRVVEVETGTDGIQATFPAEASSQGVQIRFSGKVTEECGASPVRIRVAIEGTSETHVLPLPVYRFGG